MGSMRILVVRRAEIYSPGNIANDAAILEAVAEELRTKGCEVTFATEEDLAGMDMMTPDAIAGMYRSAEALEALARLEREGIVAVNTSQAVKNCRRSLCARIMQRAAIPSPRSISGNCSYIDISALHPLCECGCWIKTGNGETTKPDDVLFAPSAEDAMATLAGRVDENVVVSEHLPGDLVKFYGVGDGRFFRHYYADEIGKSKFGLERVNGAPRRLRFDEASFRNNCFRAARAVGTAVFGGDAVVGNDGIAKIIDFNDWPSFSPCCLEAASAIANEIISRAKETVFLNTRGACEVYNIRGA